MQYTGWTKLKYEEKHLQCSLIFECMFIDQYTPLDDKNVARDKLQ